MPCAQRALRWGRWDETLNRLTQAGITVPCWRIGGQEIPPKGQGFLHLFLRHVSVALAFLRFGRPGRFLWAEAVDETRGQSNAFCHLSVKG